MDKGVFKRIIIGQKGFIHSLILWHDIGFIFHQHLVQEGFLLFDLLNQENHGIVVRGHNVAESHLVDVHGGLADVGQPVIAGHVIVGNPGCTCIDVVNIDNGKNIG